MSVLTDPDEDNGPLLEAVTPVQRAAQRVDRPGRRRAAWRRGRRLLRRHLSRRGEGCGLAYGILDALAAAPSSESAGSRTWTHSPATPTTSPSGGRRASVDSVEEGRARAGRLGVVAGPLRARPGARGWLRAARRDRRRVRRSRATCSRSTGPIGAGAIRKADGEPPTRSRCRFPASARFRSAPSYGGPTGVSAASLVESVEIGRQGRKTTVRAEGRRRHDRRAAPDRVRGLASASTTKVDPAAELPKQAPWTHTPTEQQRRSALGTSTTARH